MNTVDVPAVQMTPQQIEAAFAARAMGKHAEVPAMPITRLVDIFDQEVEHAIKRAFMRAEMSKIHFATAAQVRKALRQTQAILWALRDIEAESRG